MANLLYLFILFTKKNLLIVSCDLGCWHDNYRKLEGKGIN
jgi:hypothetical protein